MALGWAFVATGWTRRQSRDVKLLRVENETLRDELWESVERETAARQEGALALEQSKAAAAAGDRAKSRFLATVTHEMRTPLSGVIGTAELLLETPLGPDQRTYARAVKSSAEAMLTLVDEILDISRIEADRPKLQPAPFAVASLVEDVVELLAPRAHAKGLDLALLVARDAPAEITADAARVRQVLINLAGNALKFTSQGGVGLRVDRGDNAVRFTVTDTGPGFDPAETERLFQEFERAVEDQSAGGVGLGLAISRRLAEAMGGRLEAQATPGQGASFTLTLPHAEADAAPLRGAPLAGHSMVVASAGPFTGPWLVESLLALGAEAALARPEAGAVAAAVSARAADVVLIDRGPAGSADRLAVAARQSGATRVLLMLAPSERGELARLTASGFDGYLVKPVRPASLLNRIEEPCPLEARAEASGGGQMTFPGSGGLNVLVAEDDPVSALIALAHLARLGHASVHVADGLAACEAFATGRFDAVLLDIRMPLLDGCAAARRMRAHEAASGRAPALLVALTANASADDRAAAADAGMDGLIGKPLDRRVLEDVLAPLASVGVERARVVGARA